MNERTLRAENPDPSQNPLIDIGIPEISVTEKTCNGRQMLLTAVPSRDMRPEHCPLCGYRSVVIQKKGTKQFRDLDIGIYRVGIVLRFSVYRCNGCESIITPEFPFIDGGCTKRLKERIHLDSFEMEFADVAKMYGITPMTVGRYFREKAEEYWASYELEMPEVLGLDEVHLKKHYYGVFVSVDRGHGDVLDITESRTKESVKAKLSEFACPERLKMVTMDMWRPYRDAVKELFPDVPIVIDRFHVIKELQRGLEAIRCRIGKRIKAEKDGCGNRHTRVDLQREKVALKNNRFLLLFSEENLSPSQVRNRDKLLSEYPEFREPYIIKEAFRSIYEIASSKAEALAMYEEWKKEAQRYEDFHSFIRMVENWKAEIFAYFDFDGENRTNAQTESFNSLIKEKERNGRGLSYEVMRAKMIFRRNGKRTVSLFDFNAFKS